MMGLVRMPEGPSGRPTLRTQHIRTYGTGGFRLGDQEQDGGCPRLYRAKYVERRVSAEKRSDALSYGTTIHNALYQMEENAIGPEEALERVWPASLGIEHWKEARADMQAYLERGGPMNRYATLGVELELDAPLYEDEEHGWVHFGGRLDWLGVDLEQPDTLHMVDYKTNRHPPKLEDVQGDVQLMGYDWLVRQKYGKDVVVHLDAIKWRDVAWQFSAEDLETWREWAAAIARRILRDTKGEPVLNPGCGWCPIKGDCPAYRQLPGIGVALAERRQSLPLSALYQWRKEAAVAVRNLKAGMDEVDEALREKATVEGPFTIGDVEWALEDAWENDIDLLRLHEVIGDRLYSLVSTSKTALERLCKEMPDQAEAIMACVSRIPVGQKVKSGKVKAT